MHERDRQAARHARPDRHFVGDVRLNREID